jgi:hypothetical protein
MPVSFRPDLVGSFLRAPPRRMVTHVRRKRSCTKDVRYAGDDNVGTRRGLFAFSKVFLCTVGNKPFVMLVCPSNDRY